MKVALPDSIRKKLQKAGRARAAQMTSEDRSEYGRRAWQTRLAKARKDKP